METEAAVFVDPEEDEIFFYEVTEREKQLKKLLEGKPVELETISNPRNCSEQSDQRLASPDRNSEYPQDVEKLSTDINSERMQDLKDPNEGPDPTLLILDCYQNDRHASGEPPALADVKQEPMPCDGNQGKQGSDIGSPQTTPFKKRKDPVYENKPNEISAHFDHNYSSPFRNVIDKNILKTPKSIVKADKDGGFLKVLSEIALVKAEVDENTVKESLLMTDSSPVKETLNDDDKENKHCDNETGNTIIKSTDVSPKLQHGHAMKKSNSDDNRKMIYTSLEKVNELNEDNSGDISNLSTTEPLKPSETAENEKNFAGDTEKVPVKIIITSPQEKSYELKSYVKQEEKEADELEIVFQKVTDLTGHSTNPASKQTDGANSSNLISFTAPEESKTEQEPNIIQPSTAVVDVKEEFNEMINMEHVDLDSCGDKLMRLGYEAAKVIKVNEGSGAEDMKQDVINSEDSSNFKLEKEEVDVKCAVTENVIQKRCLRRNTLRLLEELNDMINKDHVETDSSCAKLRVRLSEEAAKVIEVLKVSEMDDSISSPDQYFDLDKLNSSMFGAELTDLLNDTLSKPLCHLTDEDVELLLEKLTSNAAESGLKPGSQLVQPTVREKENVCQNKMVNNVPYKSVQPVRDVKKTPNCGKVNLGQFGKASSAVKSQVSSAAKSVQLKGNDKLLGNAKCLSEKKTMNFLGRLENDQNRVKDGVSVEKDNKPKGVTRIPKLALSVSKIPRMARDVKVQNPRETPTTANKMSSRSTPLNKVQRNLKFRNIESPVQAYIHSKTPVLISNVKAKGDSAFSARKKLGENLPKPVGVEAKTKIQKSEPKSNLPFVNYKSATPFKLEKSPESRLPKLAPKLEKLIGSNSPVISKHEGRIQIASASAPGRPANPNPTPLNESSVMVNPNEVSVLVRKVAQKNVHHK